MGDTNVGTQILGARRTEALSVWVAVIVIPGTISLPVTSPLAQLHVIPG